MFTRYHSDSLDFPKVGETGDNFSLNEYFRHPLDKDHNLISTRHGGWILLSDAEYQILKSGKLAGHTELFQALERVGIVLTERSIRAVARDLGREHNFVFYPTNYHVIAITNKCNFNCIYCHPDANPQKGEMTEETARKVLDFIFSIPMTGGCQIIIEGGEPLLKWDLIKFIHAEAKKRADAKGLELRFSFTTNLSLMTDEIAQQLADWGVHPCISLDGPKELHDKQRPLLGGQGSHDKVMYWAKRLKENYDLKIYAIPVITRLALEYGPESIIDEYLKIGQNVVFFKPFRASGRALDNFQELAMTPVEFFEFWKKGIEYLISLNKKGRKAKELNTTYFIANIVDSFRKSMCHHRPCGAGFSILSYDCEGVINGCDAARGQGFLDFGHVDTDDYPSIRTKATSLLALTPDLIPICSTCPFISYCGNCISDVFGLENDVYPKAFRNFGCQWQKRALEYIFQKFAENGEDASILYSWKAA